MSKLVLHPTTTAQWHSLIMEAQARSEQIYSEDLESYLVFLLMRYTSDVAMAQSVLAVEYLEGQTGCVGRNQKETLQAVGDKCLLFSGLFPERAKKKCVSRKYFIEMGRGAYASLSDLQLRRAGELFSGLSNEFIRLTNVLQAMRQDSLGSLLLFEGKEGTMLEEKCSNHLGKNCSKIN